LDLWDVKPSRWFMVVLMIRVKKDFLIQLAIFCNSMDSPYIVGGDFNIIRRIGEKKKCTPISFFLYH
jgi:hypothetical protein